jgi:hypothetical protein
MTILEQARAIRAAMDKAGMMLSATQAASVVYLYENWDPFMKNENNEWVTAHYNVGDRRRYDEVVYECRQEHDAQEIYTPDMIPALWTRLDVEHVGTLEDPIPFATGMEIFSGKYYIENEIIYLCSRDSQQPLYNNLSDLVGLYVELV